MFVFGGFDKNDAAVEYRGIGESIVFQGTNLFAAELSTPSNLPIQGCDRCSFRRASLGVIPIDGLADSGLIFVRERIGQRR